jgi:polysaccharide biosynthesis protein PslF
MTSLSQCIARRIAIVSTYPPTQCGLATFAAATRRALSQVRPELELPIIEVMPAPRPWEVDGSSVQWIHGDNDSLNRATRCANSCDVVILQHEYGIFGGEDGNEVVAFLDGVQVPIVAVLHTVVRDPSMNQRRILAVLGRECACVVVMSEAARRRLLQVSSVPAHKVVVIAHGAHSTPYRLPLSSERPPEMLTWGLVGPGKGLEHGIDAVADVVRRGIDVRYRIVGETHPNVRQANGEQYRNALVARAHHLGISDHVEFDATYRPIPELLPIIGNADLVLIPYDSTEQVTSGVLVEALASGRPVVATDFPHAAELLNSGAGIVVSHHDTVAMADAIVRVLCNPRQTQQMSRRALRLGQTMLWPAVGESFAKLADLVVEHQANDEPTNFMSELASATVEQGSTRVGAS